MYDLTLMPDAELLVDLEDQCVALAVEALEGTDACIRRSGEFCPQGGFTVVKVAKPQQDMRFDVPTIGLGTIESMLAARASVRGSSVSGCSRGSRSALRLSSTCRRCSGVSCANASACASSMRGLSTSSTEDSTSLRSVSRSDSSMRPTCE